MSSKTKIVVLRMKELIYTAIFAGFAVLLIILLSYMLRSGKDTAADGNESPFSQTETDVPSTEHTTGHDTPVSYTPGLYASSITLGSQTVDVEVTVDSNRITSVVLVPINDSVAAMYPLMQPTMDKLAPQILENQSLDGIEYPANAQYTSVTLMQAVKSALEKAKTEQ